MSAAKALPARQQAVVDALRNAQGRKKNFPGLKPSEIAVLANVASSSQTCTLLRALIAKKLVKKNDAGQYKLSGA